MKKETSIISSIIFPNDKNIEIRNNNLLQLNMYLASLRRFQDIINIVLITNEVLVTRKIARINNIKEKNLEIIYIDNKFLKCCNNEKGELHQFAFSKIDILRNIKSYLLDNKKIKNIIISDIDCLFLKVKKLINYASNVKSIAAINYRSEISTDKRFDNLIKDCIDNSILNKKKYPKRIPPHQMAWINSGFMIINRKLAIELSEYSRKLYLWFSQNKKRVKRVCSNHYSDELIFSTIFNLVGGFEIDNKTSKIARFIWTCNTKTKTQNKFNPINSPAHLHLPSLKWEKRHLIIISYLFINSFCSKIGLIFINIWSIENRLNKVLKKLIFFKILFGILRIIENMILKINLNKFDFVERNLIQNMFI